MPPCRLHLAVCLLLAAQAWALSIGFDDPGPLVMNPGELKSIAWTVQPPGAKVDILKPTGFPGDLQCPAQHADGRGYLLITLPAGAKPGRFNLVLSAQAGATTKSSAPLILRINSPPALSKIGGGTSPAVKGNTGSVTILEDSGDTVITLTLTDSDDTFDVPLTGTRDSMDARFQRADLVPIGTKLFTLTIRPAADRFTSATAPAPITLLIRDNDGGSTLVTLDVTIKPVNDPPSIVPTIVPDPDLVYSATSDLGTAIGSDLVLREDRDELDDPTATTALYSTYTSNGVTAHRWLRWIFAVEDGSDGADILAVAPPDGRWQVVRGDIQFRPPGGAWTKVAAWDRTIGATNSNRSDQLRITLVDSPFRAQVAPALPTLVRYRWFLGLPPIPADGSPFVRRVDIMVDEPLGSGWERRSTPLTRAVTVQDDNVAPEISGGPLRCAPRESTPLVLRIVDDDPSRGEFLVRRIEPADAGLIYASDDPQQTAVSRFGYADLGKIRFQHLDAEVDSVAVSLDMDDRDPRGAMTGTCIVEFRIAPEKPRFAFLCDPILQATAIDGACSEWPLRFTHAVPVAPRLSAYPGLDDPFGMWIVGDAASGWWLAVDWSQVDARLGYLACVISAETDDAGARAGRAASQAVMILVRRLDEPEAQHARVHGVDN